MIRKLILVLLLVFNSSLIAQEIDYRVELNTTGIIYGREESPFWMHSNKRGRIDEKTNLASWISGEGIFKFRDDGEMTVGLGILYNDGFSSEVKLDEFFVSYENRWFEIFAGRKQIPESFNGLSATNENILQSTNARPLPGVGFKIVNPIMLWDTGLGLKASWEEFFTDESKANWFDANPDEFNEYYPTGTLEEATRGYIHNLRVHHKSFHLVYKGIRNLELSAGVNHYVQWGGKSEKYGVLPAGFTDYIKVVTGGSFSGEGLVGAQEINGLGNHIGGYEAQLKTSFRKYNITIVYNTIFEDMSGIKWRNTPDGRYGIFIEDQDSEKWISSFMYEYYFTRNQSKNYPTSDGKDNYFNNHLYRSGWTYEQRVIGAPFFMLDKYRYRVKHNNLVVHHLGIGGNAFYAHPYKLLVSYRGNYGVKSGSSKPIEQIISTFLDINVWQEFVKVDMQIGVDIDFEKSSKVGFGINISKKLL